MGTSRSYATLYGCFIAPRECWTIQLASIASQTITVSLDPLSSTTNSYTSSNYYASTRTRQKVAHQAATRKQHLNHVILQKSHRTLWLLNSVVSIHLRVLPRPKLLFRHWAILPTILRLFWGILVGPSSARRQSSTCGRGWFTQLNPTVTTSCLLLTLHA